MYIKRSIIFLSPIIYPTTHKPIMASFLQDPDVMDGLMLGATFAAREALVKRQISSLSEVATVAISQTVYDKFIEQYGAGLIGGITGEKYWSSLLANAAGLSLVLYSFRRTGVISRASEDIGDGAILPSPSSPMLSSIVEAGELLIEKNILEAVLTKSGWMPAGASKVVPTTTTMSGLSFQG